ncbi:unnamed protein product [Cuscuta campestris]|uniref:Uncharacterized protein n=1 Tax=Cuscuta campestris TaxID=132261 RepID=A0A484L5L1_9ASTE|nr:unnamed protein product [Cuscuta campestris]
MAALKEQNQMLQEQIDSLTSSLSLMIQEEIRKLYGGNLPQQGNDDGTGGAGQHGFVETFTTLASSILNT